MVYENGEIYDCNIYVFLSYFEKSPEKLATINHLIYDSNVVGFLNSLSSGWEPFGSE